MIRMIGDIGSFPIFAGMVILGILIACPGGPHQGKKWTQVQVTDVGTVAGVWEGVVEKNNTLLPDGSVRLLFCQNGPDLFAGQSLTTPAIAMEVFEIREGRPTGECDWRTVTKNIQAYEGQVQPSHLFGARTAVILKRGGVKCRGGVHNHKSCGILAKSFG